MRRILVDHASLHRAAKRGGEWCKVEFDEALAPSFSRSVDVIALDDALQDLVQLNPIHSQIAPCPTEPPPKGALKPGAGSPSRAIGRTNPDTPLQMPLSLDSSSA